jgi:methionyl aminopeptidase
LIDIKTEKEIGYMAAAGKILTACHREIAKIIKPGITTMEIDNFVEKFLKKHNATPEQKGYMGFPYATCASVNDEICHGFPSDTPLKDGDIVTIDMVVNLNGWLADSAWSYGVGNISKQAKDLLKVTKDCLYRGIEKAVIGNHIGDIGHEIQTYAESLGYSVVRDYTGHGIGQEMHDDISVPHCGKPGRGLKLREGMVITIEPMINIGTYRTTLDKNGWTARTEDGSLSAQYEHTLAITKNGPLVLTEQN